LPAECLDFFRREKPVSADFAAEASVLAELPDASHGETQSFGRLLYGECCFHAVNISPATGFYKTYFDRISGIPKIVSTGGVGCGLAECLTGAGEEDMVGIGATTWEEKRMDEFFEAAGIGVLSLIVMFGSMLLGFYLYLSVLSELFK
jgi:hypothetical protein